MYLFSVMTFLSAHELQGGSGGKTWIKAVQKEWKILENSLPGTSDTALTLASSFHMNVISMKR
jgi:hypothetical protein